MMIGPAPMIRMLSMSVRLGIAFSSCLPLFHHLREAVEEIAKIMGTGACFRMALEAERRLVCERETLKGAVEERNMRHARRGWKRRGIDREAVILAGDQDLAGVLVEHGMVRAVMTELHLERLAADGEAQQLVPQADAESRLGRREEFADRRDRIVAGLGISGSVRQKDAVG